MQETKTELQRIAIQDERKKELSMYQRALDVQWLNSRMEDGRMGRCLSLIKQEAEMEKRFQERTDHAAIVNARAEKEIALGREIYRRRREKECELLRRRFVRENDTSLKELAKKLQAGYICKELRQQLLHNEYRRLQQKAEEKAANAELQNALYTEAEAELLRQKQKIEKQQKLGNELRQQLVNNQLRKQCQYEDTLIEKKMLEEVMRTIADEDHRELEQKKRLTEKTRMEIETFKKAQDAWKMKQRAMIIQEEKEIERQQKLVADRNSSSTAEEERKQKIKDEIMTKICAKNMAEEAANQERVEQIRLLQEQEYIEKNKNDEKAEMERLERVKRETKEALLAQMEIKKKLLEDTKRADEEYRKQTVAKIEEDLAKEREKELKKRIAGRAYSQELRQQMHESRLARQRAADEDAGRARCVWDCDKTWLLEVAEERKKMIAENVPPLIGFLQGGVIKKEDLPLIREGANKHPELAKLEIEKMGESPKILKFPKCNAKCLSLRE